MKKKSIIGLFFSLMGLGAMTTSCEDMLTPDVDRYSQGFSGKDTVNFYFGILANLQDMVENNMLLADMRSDLVQPTDYVSDSVASIINFEPVGDTDNGLLNRAGYYKVINQCNYYLAAADTLAQKNSIYYMRTEFAQVQFVRAWTYMQLVQTYGKVPFITKPVDNAGTGWETNPEAWAESSNLLDLLLEDGLQRAYEFQKVYGLPSYGTLNNGHITMPETMCNFPGDLVMGDLYLLRGRSKADYEQAAMYYYTYINEQARDYGQMVTTSYRAAANVSRRNNMVEYFPSGSYWIRSFTDRSSNVSNHMENITLSLSASSSNFGTVMTRSAQIYGYDPESSTFTGTDDNAEEDEVNTTGQISVTANFRNRQLMASPAYKKLSDSQDYRFSVNTERDENSETMEDINKVTYPEKLGDCRYSGVVKEVRTTAGNLPFVQTRATTTNYSDQVSPLSFNFNYTYPLYRLCQVYLRFAEAVNRAGFPRHAFAILRDGLSAETLPDVVTMKNNKPVYRVDAEGVKHAYPILTDVADGCSYIGVDEMRRAESMPFLFFNDTYWEQVSGIHELGCGYSSDLDDRYTYANMVGQRMYDERLRTNTALGDKTEAADFIAALENEIAIPSDVVVPGNDDEEEGDEGDEEGGEEGGDEEEIVIEDALDPVVPEDLSEQINAVETLIADEMALELPFQGFRYFDLQRMALHKNNCSDFGESGYGTNWFAWLISRRMLDLKPYENPTEVDGTLYGRLQNESNWYLQNPKY